MSKTEAVGQALGKFATGIEKEWKTFMLAAFIIGCATWQLNIAAIDMPVWKEMMYFGGGIYTARTVVAKFAPKKS